MTDDEFRCAKAYIKGKGVNRAATWGTIGGVVGGPVGGAVGAAAGYVSGMADGANDIDSGRVRPEPADGLRQLVGLDPKGRKD